MNEGLGNDKPWSISNMILVIDAGDLGEWTPKTRISSDKSLASLLPFKWKITFAWKVKLVKMFVFHDIRRLSGYLIYLKQKSVSHQLSVSSHCLTYLEPFSAFGTAHHWRDCREFRSDSWHFDPRRHWLSMGGWIMSRLARFFFGLQTILCPLPPTIGAALLLPSNLICATCLSQIITTSSGAIWKALQMLRRLRRRG